MKRTTIFVDEAVEHDLKTIAARRCRPVASLVREALAEYVMSEKSAGPTHLSFVGAGASGHVDTADRHEEILWEDVTGADVKSPLPRMTRPVRRKNRDRRGGRSA
jgi:predicted transcriptional regulator